MTVPRIYFPRIVENHRRYKLRDDDLLYVRSVLRMREGDALILFDGIGGEYETVIRNVSRDGIDIEIMKKVEIPQRDVTITLLQSLPKANKMDFIVQKATELGADRIIPILSTRSVPRFSPEKEHLRRVRWQNIAKEAARQCGRADIPTIDAILSFEGMIRGVEGIACKIILWEEESTTTLKDVLREGKCRNVRDIAVVVGPEGGFTKGEIERAGEAGFVAVNLGRIILRVETASLAVLSIIQYEKGIFDKGREHRRG